ncbi:MAG TPA: hypothetical protein PLB22_03035, partial [Ottowia sp.]|nr:hypothetical protein [Ottowia sp.]
MGAAAPALVRAACRGRPEPVAVGDDGAGRPHGHRDQRGPEPQDASGEIAGAGRVTVRCRQDRHVRVPG